MILAGIILFQEILIQFHSRNMKREDQKNMKLKDNYVAGNTDTISSKNNEKRRPKKYEIKKNNQI